MSEYVDIAPRPVRLYRVIVGEWEYTYEITTEMDWVRFDIDGDDSIPIARAVVEGRETLISWKSRILVKGVSHE